MIIILTKNSNRDIVCLVCDDLNWCDFDRPVCALMKDVAVDAGGPGFNHSPDRPNWNIVGNGSPPQRCIFKAVVPR